MAANKQTRTAYHESGHCIASVQLGIPVVAATIANGRPHFTRGRFRRSRDLAIEHLVIVCLAGPEAERLFCGEIKDHGDKIDVAMAKSYIADGYPDESVHGFQLSRLRSAAASLVRTPWAKARIQRLADALLEHGSLGADAIYELTASRIRPARPDEYGNAYVIGGQSPR